MDKNTEDIIDIEVINEFNKTFKSGNLSAIRAKMAKRSPPNLSVLLEFKNITYSIRNEDGTRKQILHGLTGIARPGELTIVMGPTGSGKTTLLSCLSRRLKKDVEGEILVNGAPPTKDYKRQVAFVLQDDILFQTLNVYKTLYYTALLRLNSDLSHQAKIDKVNEIIDSLGLDKVRDTLIGGEFFKGVSGGERKRVNIGNEILTDPSLILLDEPTSGLDTSTALNLLQMLKGMAESGLTIVATIHQPSSQMWELFDNLLLLVEGQSIYFGKANQAVAYFAAIGLNCEKYWNPADFIMGLILTEEVAKRGGKSVKNELVIQWKKTLELKNEKNFFILDSDRKLAEQMKEKQAFVGTPSYAIPFWQQIWVLFQREWNMAFFKFFDTYKWLQTLGVAFCVGILWFNLSYTTEFSYERLAMIFFSFNYSSVFIPAFEALFAFPFDRAIVIRERNSGSYRLSSYYISKILVEIPWYFPTSIVFIVITYFMANLRRTAGAFFVYFFVNILAIFVSTSFGIFISAITLPDMKAATSTLTVIIMLLFVLGGFFIQNYPSWISWAPYLSFFKYTYDALLINEFSGVNFTNTTFTNINETINGTINEVVIGDSLIEIFLDGYPRMIYANALILLLMGVVIRFLGFFALSFSIKR